MKSKMLMCMTAMTLFAALAITVPLAAQNKRGLKETVLYTFTGGTDGAVPFFGTLIQDKKGNLYGTTLAAGDLSACANGSATGCGVVYKVDPAGNESVLYRFTGGTDGGAPMGSLVRDEAGNLYSTTNFGGGSGLSAGTVFKLGPPGNETVLYGFTGGTDGNTPYAGLVRDKDGNLYGTTLGGGNSGACAGGCGVVFRVDPAGHETVLHSFTGGADGSGPSGDLLRDSDGNLYGTTEGGGTSKAGVVFKLDPANKETVLYNFKGGADGANPFAGVIRDEAGNLYGTASAGGLSGCPYVSGCGVVFKVDPTGKETVLYSFTGGTDGYLPYAPLVRDPQGNLYGTTFFGGDQGAYCAGFCGVVFKVSPTGKETVLYAFTGQADGNGPAAGLLRDKWGNLYGTTENGGDLASPQGNCAGIGCGVVFKILAPVQRGGDSENDDEGANLHD